MIVYFSLSYLSNEKFTRQSRDQGHSVDRPTSRFLFELSKENKNYVFTDKEIE